MNYRFLSTLALVCSMYTGVKAVDPTGTIAKPQVAIPSQTRTITKPQVATPSQKIGYVDLDYIFGNLPEAKKNNAELQSYQKQLDNQIQSKYKEFQEKVEALRQEEDRLTEAQKKQKFTELQNMEFAVHELNQAKPDKMQAKYRDLIQPIHDKTQAVISEIATQHAYDLVLNKNTAAGPVVFFCKNQFNISDLVLEKLKAMVPKEETPPVVGSKAQMAPKAPSKTAKPVNKK